MTGQQLKNAILALAVQGKLVPQDPKDEPATALLERVKAEKARLVKAGKIKKEKPLPPITDAEKPFEIPAGWEWIRLGDIGVWGSGATPSKSNPEFYNNASIPWLVTGDLNDGIIEEIPGKISQLALEKTSVKLNPANSVLVAMYGATIGKVGLLSFPATTNQACCACQIFDENNVWYLMYFLMSQRNSFIKKGAGGAQPNISKEKIVITLMPLPPIEEQKRIVAKIEELLPLVESYDKAEQKISGIDADFPDKLKKSILQQAFTGKMTSKWRKDTGRSIGSWKWVTFGELGSTRLGKMLDKGKNIGTDTKYLRNINVRWFGFQLDDILTIRATDEEKEKLSIEDGDLLICEGGEPGRCAVWTYGKTRYIYQKAIHRFRPNASCLSQFIAYYLYYLSVSGKLEPYFTGATFRHLTGKKLVALPVYLPTIEEQKCIVGKVEKYLTLCDKMKSRICKE